MEALFSLPTSRRPVLAIALVGMLAWPVFPTAQSPSQSPSLAELARKEAERRKTVKDSKKVITNKDLPESARKPASTAAEGGAQTGAQSSPQSSEDQKPAAGTDTASIGQGSSGLGDESAWRQRMTAAREGLRRNEVFLQALQTRLNALTNDVRNGAGNFPQQVRNNEERDKALQELERVKAEVELSKKQVADIEEEARKAGVPPGWLR